MPRIYRLVVGSTEAHQRLDRYLVARLPQGLSRVAIQRAIRDGSVTVGGQVAKAHRRLNAGEVVSARVDQLGATPSRSAVAVPEPIPLDIAYEDEALLVVNKPPGLVTHPAPGHWSGTLVNAVLWHLERGQGIGQEPSPLAPCPPGPPGSSQAGAGTPLPRAGLVHRLDKDTSGLLIVAKTERALRDLAKQLKARTMSRRYLAFVEGHPPDDEGVIDASIGRHATHRKIMTVRYLGGRQAVTRYRVLQRFNRHQTSDIRHQTSGKAVRLKSEVWSLESELPFPYTLLEVKLQDRGHGQQDSHTVRLSRRSSPAARTRSRARRS